LRLKKISNLSLKFSEPKIKDFEDYR